MNKKLLTIPALMLVATLGLSASKASAEGLSVGANLGVHTDDSSISASATATSQVHSHPMIPVMPPREGDHPSSGVFGTVTAVNGNTITVQTKTFVKGSTSSAATTYTVDASSAIIDKNKTAITVAGISVGDSIMVEGKASGSVVTAARIHDGVMVKGLPGSNGGVVIPKKGDATIPDGNGQPVVGGTVSAVSGNNVTFTNKGNVSYTADVTNAKIIKNGTVATASTIAVGDTVLTQGTINGSSIVAVSLIDSSKVSSDEKGSFGFFASIGNFFSRLFGKK